MFTCEWPECRSTDTVPVCIDDDYEGYMCKPHIRDANASGELEVVVMEDV